MTGRPLVLLDVDGMLSPFAADEPPPGYIPSDIKPHPDWRAAVRLNPEHGPMLLEFAAKYDVELAWATLWNDNANRLVAPLIGLPQLPVAYNKLDDSRWKYPGVFALAGRRPIVWFDDQFGEPHERAAWLNYFHPLYGDTPSLFRRVDPAVGLTSAHLDQAAEWLEATQKGRDGR